MKVTVLTGSGSFFFLHSEEASLLSGFLAAFLFGCCFLFLGAGSCSCSCLWSDFGSSNRLEFTGSFRNLASSARSSEVSSRIMKMMKVTKLSCSNLAKFFYFVSKQVFNQEMHIYVRKTYIPLTPIISASNISPP